YDHQLETIYDKSKETLPEQYAKSVINNYLYIKDKLLNTSNHQPIVLENGHSFVIDWESGQKTGFFLDQRDNRQLLTYYVKNKTVLNTFCYTGGFSVYALNAGAGFVESVDVS